MFKNILCPIDFKPRSKMALKKAIHIAHQFNSRIVLLNIDERFKTKEQREQRALLCWKPKDFIPQKFTETHNIISG